MENKKKIALFTCNVYDSKHAPVSKADILNESYGKNKNVVHFFETWCTFTCTHKLYRRKCYFRLF